MELWEEGKGGKGDDNERKEEEGEEEGVEQEVQEEQEDCHPTLPWLSFRLYANIVEIMRQTVLYSCSVNSKSYLISCE